ncbi:MAG: hypothetical protein QOE94_86 [Mycobacterium sp.]|jgi:hypothetical protein|nr:hypothetical protein [Mycobacterium sp.]
MRARISRRSGGSGPSADGSVGTSWWDAGVNNGLWNTPFEIAPAGSAES